MSTKALKTVEKRGLQAMAVEAGIDLWKLPFEDARPERLQWLQGAREGSGSAGAASHAQARWGAGHHAAPTRCARPRLALTENGGNPPMAKNPRKMKNPEKLAASTKAPLVARYISGKIAYVRADAGVQ